MTKEEISVYAYEPTNAPRKTIITFSNGEKVSGFFDGNLPNSKNYQKNKWSFIVIPQKDNLREPTIFNGDNFHNITI